MKRLFTFALLAGIPFLAGCGGGGGSNDPSGLTAYTCSLPCLKSAPSVSPTTVSSATGGTVTVSFEIDGAFADLDMIHVALDHVSAPESVGYTFVLAPFTGSTVSVDITIDAGATEGTYYPNIFFENTAGDYGQYVLATDFSATKYLYGQTIGTTETHALSPFNVPLITVTP